MKIWVGLFLLAGFGMEGAAVVEARTLPQDTPAATLPVITDGARAFKVSGCAQCHMINGVGGHKGPDLSGIGRRGKKDYIEMQIVKGGDAMPAFGDALPTAEIKALVEYLHKQKTNTPAWPAMAPVVAAKAEDSSGV